MDDKSIDEIQSIFQSKKAKNFSKQANGNTSNLAIAFRDKCILGKKKQLAITNAITITNLGTLIKTVSSLMEDKIEPLSNLHLKKRVTKRRFIEKKRTI